MLEVVGMEGFWVLFILLLFCSQAQVLNSQNPSCDSKDLNALEGFLKGLDSGNIVGWGNTSSSSSSGDCCSWVGIKCEPPSGFAGVKVVGLNLGNRGLRGVVLKELAGLDQLKVINLSSNSLNSALPLELFHMQHLEVLDLSFNRFSGSIPVDTDLPSIQVFNISGNSFTGKQPLLVGSTNLTHYRIGYNSLTGNVNTGICINSSRVQFIQLSMNMFDGTLPAGFGNCVSLRLLSLDSNHLTGALPDDLFGLSRLNQLFLQDNMLSSPLSLGIGNLSKLVHLDLSNNGFRGAFPDVFSNISNLRHLVASSNFFGGNLPPSLLSLPKLQMLNLRNNSFEGEINLNCTAMIHLNSLDLGSNRFSGRILENLSSCRTLKSINLARNYLNGQIPNSLMNLQDLSYLSLSNSSLHNISAALRILEQFKNLTTLVLTLNFRGEEMPADGDFGFQSLKVFVAPNCGLWGSIPSWLQGCSKLQLLDLSWNRLGGSIPSWFSVLDSLFYMDLSNNSLIGEIPKSLTQLKGLISRSVLPEVEDSSPNFPFFFKRNQSTSALQYNQFTSFPPTLDLSNNNLTGPILPEFGNLKDLHVLDLSRNNLTGTIPSELSGMVSLEVLDLSYNDLSGNIPASLTKLSFLSSFSVAHNNLSGPVPLEGQFSTFPNSSFEGNEDLCGDHLSPCTIQNTSQPRRSLGKNRRTVIGMTVGIGLGTASLLALVLLFLLRTNIRREDKVENKVEDAEKHFEFSGSRLVLLFQNTEHKEITIDDLLKSTNNFDQANIIGCGGFGLVYKASLPDGRKVAIKRLSGDCGQMNREFQAEVESLSRAQHKNLVLLQGYCCYGNDRLLIYSYMENGSLDYWLHEKLNGGYSLNWDTRLRIAQGAARGLAYLHQSCHPHILHRDIKSSNILLDENFEAHLADFGLARLILPYETHVTTDLVGTLGYIPPEYGQASVATFKGDVYSFGVVLLELLTGKRPVEVCKPRGCRNLIAWVLQMNKEKRENEVFDPVLCDQQCDKQMLQVLDIACLCLSDSPKVRPFIQQIVSWLDEVGHDGQIQPTK